MKMTSSLIWETEGKLSSEGLGTMPSVSHCGGWRPLNPSLQLLFPFSRIPPRSGLMKNCFYYLPQAAQSPPVHETHRATQSGLSLPVCIPPCALTSETFWSPPPPPSPASSALSSARLSLQSTPAPCTCNHRGSTCTHTHVSDLSPKPPTAEPPVRPMQRCKTCSKRQWSPCPTHK